MKDLNGKVAVVTGAAQGIGRAFAGKAHGLGMRVVLSDVNAEGLAKAVAELPGSIGFACDVSKAERVEELAAFTYDAFGAAHVVINNAGLALGKSAWETTLAEWDRMIGVNVYGVIRGVRAFLPHMLERGSGHIINTASLAGLFAYAWDSVPYITGKFAVAGFTEALALYAKPLGVGVTLVCPGLVDTNLGETARFVGVADPSEWLREIQLPPAVAPEEVATRVVDAVAEDRFLVTTAEDHVKERVTQRAADHDQFVADMIGRLPTPPNLHRG